MWNALWIFVGGGLGSLARWGVSGLVANKFGETFPWGTLIVNISGSFVIGLFATATGPEGRWLAPAPPFIRRNPCARSSPGSAAASPPGGGGMACCSPPRSAVRCGSPGSSPSSPARDSSISPATSRAPTSWSSTPPARSSPRTRRIVSTTSTCRRGSSTRSRRRPSGPASTPSSPHPSSRCPSSRSRPCPTPWHSRCGAGSAGSCCSPPSRYSARRRRARARAGSGWCSGRSPSCPSSRPSRTARTASSRSSSSPACSRSCAAGGTASPGSSSAACSTSLSWCSCSPCSSGSRGAGARSSVSARWAPSWSPSRYR